MFFVCCFFLLDFIEDFESGIDVQNITDMNCF